MSVGRGSTIPPNNRAQRWWCPSALSCSCPLPRSQVVFVELAQYNPSVDLHVAITLWLEFLGAGQAIATVTVSPFPLLRLSAGVTLQLLMMVSVSLLPSMLRFLLCRCTAGPGDPSPGLPEERCWSLRPEAPLPEAQSLSLPGEHTENIPGTAEGKEVPPARREWGTEGAGRVWKDSGCGGVLQPQAGRTWPSLWCFCCPGCCKVKHHPPLP